MGGGHRRSREAISQTHAQTRQIISNPSSQTINKQTLCFLGVPEFTSSAVETLHNPFGNLVSGPLGHLPTQARVGQSVQAPIPISMYLSRSQSLSLSLSLRLSLSLCLSVSLSLCLSLPPPLSLSLSLSLALSPSLSLTPPLSLSLSVSLSLSLRLCHRNLWTRHTLGAGRLLTRCRFS